MARAKKTETKKKTTAKKEAEEFPVDDIINDLKGTLITENSEQVGCKKKYKENVKEEEVTEEVLKEEVTEETLEVKEEEVIETPVVTEIETIAETDKEEEVVEKKQPTVTKKPMRKIVTSHRWMGQIIDF